MPDSSAAAQPAVRLLERWLGAARAQRSEHEPVLAPGRQERRRQERRTSSFPPKQGWRSPRERL
jgi:hypothetical protein